MGLLPEFQTLLELMKVEKLNELTWQQLMELRQKFAEKLDFHTNEKLSGFEEKIEMKNKFSKLNIPTAQVKILI